MLRGSTLIALEDYTLSKTTLQLYNGSQPGCMKATPGVVLHCSLQGRFQHRLPGRPSLIRLAVYFPHQRILQYFLFLYYSGFPKM